MDLRKFLGFRKYVINTGWLAIGKIARIVIGFLVAIMVARFLGPKNYGLLNFSISFVALFVPLGNPHYNTILVKWDVAQNTDKAILYGSALAGKIFGALLVNLLIFTTGVLFFSGKTLVMNQIIACGIFFQSFFVLGAYFQAEVKLKYPSFALIIALLLSSSLRIILIVIEADVVYFSAASLVNSACHGIFLLIFFKRKNKTVLLKKVRFDLIYSLLQESWPLILSGILILIYTRIDQIMIKFYLDETFVGQYAASVRVTETTYLLAGIITTSFFPALLHAKKKSLAEYKKRLQLLSDALLMLAVAVSLLYLVVGKPIFVFFFGSEYTPASEVLQIHIWSTVFIYLGLLYSRWLIAEKRQIVTLLRTFLGAVINILLNLLLIPRYGINGAAVATLAAQFFASYLSFAFLKMSREGFLMQTKSFLLPFRLFRFIKKGDSGGSGIH